MKFEFELVQFLCCGSRQTPNMDRFFDFTAVGMRFVEIEPGSHSRELSELDEVLLRPEPSNPHDTRAVQVCAPDGRALAHVSRETLACIPCLGTDGKRFPVHQSTKRGNTVVLFTCREH